jgi:hypothetical protein
MRHTLLLAGLALASLACLANGDDKDKGTKVVLDGMISTTPGSW